MGLRRVYSSGRPLCVVSEHRFHQGPGSWQAGGMAEYLVKIFVVDRLIDDSEDVIRW